MSRLDFKTHVPRAAASMNRLSESVELDGLLRELVNVRVSQINGCSYCIALHTRNARSLGERDERLHGLSAWEHTPFFNERERAALALCEAITRIAEAGVRDEVWARAAAAFEPPELAHLLYAIVTINAYNRLAIATRMQPGPLDPAGS